MATFNGNVYINSSLLAADFTFFVCVVTNWLYNLYNDYYFTLVNVEGVIFSFFSFSCRCDECFPFSFKLKLKSLLFLSLSVIPWHVPFFDFRRSKNKMLSVVSPARPPAFARYEHSLTLTRMDPAWLICSEVEA